MAGNTRIGGLVCALALAGFCPSLAAEPVALTYHASGAHGVSVAGGFDPYWQKRHPMRKDAAGRWVLVFDLPPGRYEFQFLVDGRWLHDPGLPSVEDSLGGRNNVLVVSPED